MYVLMYDYMYVMFVCRVDYTYINVNALYVCMYVCMYVLMYDYIYVGVDYTYIDINTLAQGIKFGFKPLLGLEPMALIRPQLLDSHTNHLATETCMYVCMY